jgi:glycosyltransferase involved in cell wall biosynthesis
MSFSPRISRIALVCDYVPRKCGIATFSADVRSALQRRFPEVDCPVVAVTDRPGYAYPPEVSCEIAEGSLASYRRAAAFINASGADVVCLQHEYGIYGGRAGSHLHTLLRELRVPVVSHLHTVLEHPSPSRRRVLNEIIRRSERVVVMSQRGRRILEEVHKVAPGRIDVIPHGIPDVPFLPTEKGKRRLAAAGRPVLLTFGLLNAVKGIEHVIAALPAIAEAQPDVLYIVLGATHPAVKRIEGEAYRRKLKRLVARLGVGRNVRFCNRFVGIEELKEFLLAADIYVTPYLHREQITSGTLAYAFGCGKAVISTPYWHAEELLAGGLGVLVPFSDSAAIANGVIELLGDKARLEAMRRQAYELGRGMIWSEVARQFMATYQQAVVAHANGSFQKEPPAA